MKKAKFKYYGYLSIGGHIALLTAFCTVLFGFSITLWRSLSVQEKWPFLFITASLVSIICWIANNIATHFKRLEYEDDQLILTNLVTKGVQKISLNKVAGYKFNGLTQKIQLINLQGESVATIYHPLYKDLAAFLLERNIKQLNMDKQYLRSSLCDD